MNSRPWHSKLTLREINKAKRGFSTESKFFAVRFSPYYRPESVFLLVASKKRVDKRAVLRNRAKRRLRAVLDTMTFRIPVCAIVIIYRETLQAKFTALIAEFKASYLLFCDKLHAARRKPPSNRK